MRAMKEFMKRRIALGLAILLVLSAVCGNYVPVLAESMDSENETAAKEPTAAGAETPAEYDLSWEDVLTYCIEYGEVTITDCDESAVEVVIPAEIEGYPVTEIGYGAFENCGSLTRIEMPDSVKEIGSYAFYECSSLTSVGMPDSLTSIGYGAFYGCGSLTSIRISDRVTSIGEQAFSWCSSLTSIEIPDSVIWIGDEAFLYCDSLTGITVLNPNCDLCSEALGSCPDTVICGYPLSTAEEYANEYSMPFESIISEGRLVSCEIISLPYKLMYEIGDELDTGGLQIKVVFDDGTSFVKETGFVTSGFDSSKEGICTINVTVGSQTVTFDVEIVEYCFGDGIRGGFDAVSETLTITGNGEITMFSNRLDKASVKKLVVGDGITVFGYCFQDCENLSDIKIPYSVTYIDSEAFRGCTSLRNITVDADNDKYSSIDGNLYEKWTDGKLSLVRYAAGKTDESFTTPENVVAIGSYAFYECSSLTSIKIPDSVTRIGNGVFSHCSSLTSIEIPGSVTEIGSYAFYECSDLTRIEIPDSVTWIGHDAFSDCSSLTRIEIPDSVTEISDDAFSDCGSLTSITILNQDCDLGSGALGSCSDTVIYGYTGSTAEEYANEYSMPFEPIIDEDRTVSCEIIFLPNKLVYEVGGELNTKGLQIRMILDDGTSFVKKRGFVLSGFDSAREGICTVNVTIGSQIVTFDVEIVEYYFGNEIRGNFDANSGTLTVTGTGKITVFSNRLDRSSVKKLVIGDGITEIGDCFENCENLSDIKIPDSVTAIASGAFKNCSALSNITIPANVRRIESQVFKGCTSLCDITVDADNDEYSSIDGNLYEKWTDGKLRLVRYAAGKADESFTTPENVVAIENSDAFEGAPLKEIVLSKDFTDAYENTFYFAEKLEKLKVLNSNAYFDGEMQFAQKLTVQGYEGSTAEVMADQSGCSFECIARVISAEIISPSNKLMYELGDELNTEGLQIKVIFDDGSSFVKERGFVTSGFDSSKEGICTVNVTVGSQTVTFDVEVVGYYVFGNGVYGYFVEDSGTLTITGNGEITTFSNHLDRSSVKKLVIGDGITVIGYMFTECENLKEINVSDKNPNYSSVKGILFDKEQLKLIFAPRGIEGDYVVPEGVESIEHAAFNDCTGLTGVEIPSSVRVIGTFAFAFCKELKDVRLSNGLEYIEDCAFEGTNIETIKLPDSLKSIGHGAFAVCKLLTDVLIPQNAFYIGTYVFGACDKLQNIEVVSDNSSFRSVDGVLFNKDMTELMQYPIGRADTTYDIPGTVKIIGEDAFAWCKNLTSMRIPDSVERIEEDAFMECRSLSEVTIGKKVSYIGSGAFSYISWYSGRVLTLTFRGDAPYIAYEGMLDEETEMWHNDTFFMTRFVAYYPEDNPTWTKDKLRGGTWIGITPESLQGDTDDDGDITVSDSILLLQYLAGYQVEDFGEAAADCDGDGDVTVADAILLLQYLAGYDVELEKQAAD